MPKILIVEDELAYQQVLKDSFEKEHFQVRLTTNGRQALADITQNTFDVLEQLK